MAEETKREAIYEIRIEQGPALRELEQTKKRLDENGFAKKQLVKETTNLLTKQQALVTTIKNEGQATEAQARLLRRYESALADNNRKVTEADALHARLSGVYREQRNDVSGLTEAHLRFRDKMADANLEAIKQSGVLGQIGAQERNLKAELAGVNAGLEKNQNTLTELNIAWKKGAITEEEYKRQLDEVNRELASGQQANAKLSKELEGVTAKSAKLEEELRQLNAEFKSGKIDQAQYQKGLKDIDNSTKTLGDKFDKFVSGQGAELKSTLSSVALQYVGVGAAIYGVQRALGSTIDTIVDFDQELANVRALGGEFKKDIDKIGQAAIELGPKFGVAPVEALKAFEALAKAGVSAGDILAGGLEGALQLSAAGTLDVAQAAEFASSAMNQFGLQGQDVTHIADLLAAGANKAAGEVSDFGNALKFVGPVAAANNVALEETVGTIALFAQSGVIGEQAGTSLRGVLSSLTSPSKAATEELKKLGITAEDGSSKLFDAQGNFKGLANLAGELQTATAGLTDEQRDYSLGLIFGNQQLTAANILVKNGAKGVNDYTKEVNSAGFANDVAGEKLNSISGEIDKAGASWEAFVLSLNKGDSVIGNIVRGSLRFLSESLQGLAGLKADETVKDIADRSDDFAKRVTANLRSLGDAFTTIQTGGGVSDALKARLDRESALVRNAAQSAVEDAGELARRRIFFQKQITDAAEQGGAKERAFAIARLQLFDELVAKGKAEADAQAKSSETIAGTRARLTAELEKEKTAFEHLNAMDARGAQASKERIASLEAEISAIDIRATATGKSVEGQSAEGKSLASLKEQLKNAKADRDLLTASDTAGLTAANANIEALQREINGLQGTSKATKDRTKDDQDRIQVLADLTKAENDRAKNKAIEAEALVQQAAGPISGPQAKAQAEVIVDSRARIKAAQGDKEILARIATETEEELRDIRNKFEAERTSKEDANELRNQERAAKGAETALETLNRKHAVELATTEAQGEELNAILARQAGERAPLEEQLQQARIDAYNASFDAEFEARVANGEAVSALIEEQERGILDIKKQSNVDELKLAQDLKEAKLNIKAEEYSGISQIAAAIAGNLEKGSAIQKALFALEKAAAIARIITNTQIEISGIAAANALLGPAGVALTTAQVTAAKIRAAVSIGVIAAQSIPQFVPGLVKGGEVNGVVRSSWGRPIRRSNGDNVLVRTLGGGAVTLQTDELVLSRQSRAKAEQALGPGIWGKLGVPGFPQTSNDIARDFRLGSLPGHVGGGIVNTPQTFRKGGGFSEPRPTPSDLLAGRLAASLESFASRPVYTSITELREVENKVDFQETASAA